MQERHPRVKAVGKDPAFQTACHLLRCMAHLLDHNPAPFPPKKKEEEEKYKRDNITKVLNACNLTNNCNITHPLVILVL